MLKLHAKLRQKMGRQTRVLRKEGFIPAVLYGPDLKPTNLKVSKKEFQALHKATGESTLINLSIEGQKGGYTALIQDLQKDPLSGQPVHIDFYQPRLTEKIEVRVPVVLEGEPPAVRESGGTLITNIHELAVKALPQNLPREIVVDVSLLKTFDDAVLVKDLILPEGVEVLQDPNEIVAKVTEPEKVEEELEKPIEEKVEEVAKVKKERKEEKEKADINE